MLRSMLPLPPLDEYIALGCLHLEPYAQHSFPSNDGDETWFELPFFAEGPSTLKTLTENLRSSGWIRVFLHRTSIGSVARIYVLPQDSSHRSMVRGKGPKQSELRQLLQNIDDSPETWHRPSTFNPWRFDPWATGKDVSLYYLFNTLPSPSPNPDIMKDRYARKAVLDLLELSEQGEDALPPYGLKTRLYPYQARSAALMIQRETSPELQLDPQLESRVSPDGKTYYYSGRDCLFLRGPRYYESIRGGILAETMVCSMNDPSMRIWFLTSF